jgi:hypothetical protein
LPARPTSPSAPLARSPARRAPSPSPCPELLSGFGTGRATGKVRRWRSP